MNNFKTALVVLLVASTLLVAGCGEEAKYNQAKSEYVKAYQAWDQQYYIPNLKDENEIFAKAETLKRQLQAMEEFSRSDSRLNNDRLALEKQLLERIKVKESQLAEDKALQKLHTRKTYSAVDMKFN